MLNIKLIACDIDGTLLDDNKNISSNMLNTINLLKEKNIIFVLITGRNDIYVKGLAKKIGIITPIVACNGALIRDIFTKKVIHKQFLDSKNVEEIIDYCLKKRYDFTLSSYDIMYCVYYSKRMNIFYEYNKSMKDEDKVLIKKFYSIKDIDTKKIFKIFLWQLSNKEKEDFYKIFNNEHIEIVSSENDGIDITLKNVNKGNAVKILANYYNLSLDNIAVFGDNDNDYIKGKINFKNVSFTYEKQVILKNVSFEIKPQSFTAIVGKSGSGKSTIFRLLLRLYKADKGTILLDDESIYDYTREVYSSNVSIVTQKPFIFDMSIRENFNLVDSNHSHQIEACKRVGIHDYIMSLKDGYNTKLVADAENISNGQKQLIALARTLLSKSEVLLFDEVTSSLDINTSKHVMEILKDLKRDHTILMITHKPSLMKLADDIIVIDHGRLVGRGSHKTLLKDNTYYKLLQK